ncbi:MAG: SDR family oxidoreductase [bacterium]|nr:SDR family oxidoreductase [bacterium]
MSEFSMQTNFAADQPVAIVTGSGAPRVGNIIARRLAKLGCAVVIHANHSMDEARQTTQEIEAAGGTAIALQADLSSEEQCEQLIEKSFERFGRIDVLVNSAAIWESKPLESATAEDVRKHFEANTLGSWVCARAAGLKMVDQPTGGVIINIGDWAIVRPYKEYAAYFPSKGAIPAMTRSLAVELGERNSAIRVNAVLPGPVMIPDQVTDEERRRTVNATIVKREGSADNIAHAVQFLIENDFITGVCLPVDGGRTIYAAP